MNKDKVETKKFIEFLKALDEFINKAIKHEQNNNDQIYCWDDDCSICDGCGA